MGRDWKETAKRWQWLVLDVDGVLIDVSESYDRAVELTVEEFASRRGEEYQLSRETVQTLRRRGGFGEDFQLSEALILSLAGAGPPALLEELPPGAGIEWVRNKFDERLDRSEIKAVFNSFYLGKGEETGSGLWQQEEPLVDKETLQRAENCFKLGVVTGRDEGEMELAETLLGFHFEHAVTRDRALKPDPEALGLLVGSSCGVYVGDTLNDQSLVENYNRTVQGGSFDFLLVGEDIEYLCSFLQELVPD